MLRVLGHGFVMYTIFVHKQSPCKEAETYACWAHCGSGANLAVSTRPLPVRSAGCMASVTGCTSCQKSRPEGPIYPMTVHLAADAGPALSALRACALLARVLQGHTSGGQMQSHQTQLSCTGNTRLVR